MTGIVKIDDDVITTDMFITMLKLSGRFETMLEEVLKEKLTVQAAKRLGIVLEDELIQERADLFRRAHGLQRASETNDYFASIGVTIDEFEQFITDALYQEKMNAKMLEGSAVEDYFQANLPKFDSMVVSHIVMSSEGAAREMLSMLREEDESFADMAREHSEADTRSSGGYIGMVMRGSLSSEVEAKVFSAEEGDLLGPFPTGDGSLYEIFRIDSKRNAQLDDETSSEIRRLLRDEWLARKAREHRIEML